MREARFYKRANSNTLSCRLCNHFCTINPGESGICQGRVNMEGRLYAVSYSRPALVNIDPIEKKPLFHFYPGSTVYSYGALGCNFKCPNCQNHPISLSQQFSKDNQKLDVVTPERLVEEALGNDCESVAATYTEPSVYAEYAIDVMKLARSAGLKNVWISNGYMSDELLDEIIPYLDAINIDLKSADPDFYEDHCRARLKPVMDNLVRLKQEQVHLELTTLVIPNLSDDIDMFERLADFIVSELDEDTPLHLSKFFPDKSWKLKHLPETSEDLIYEAYEIAKEAGLKYVYVANIPGDQKENTYCPKCGQLAIRRMDQHIERLDSHGRCEYCDRSLDIVE